MALWEVPVNVWCMDCGSCFDAGDTREMFPVHVGCGSAPVPFRATATPVFWTPDPPIDPEELRARGSGP